MGGCLGKKTAAVRVSVTEATPPASPTPDTPQKIRIRLRGELQEATVENIRQKLCEAIGESENRFEAKPAESDTYYLVTVNPLPEDEPGAARKLTKRVISHILGKGVPVTENLKMIGAKEFMVAGDL